MQIHPLLEAQNIEFSYRFDKPALNGINLKIPAGKRVAFVGPNGAGKSTLFLQFNAILRPTAGRLLYQGRPYEYSRSAITTLRQKIGLVFQDPDTQLFAGSVLDDVLFGPMNLGMSLKKAEQTAMKALEAVQMAEYANEPVHFLSHGQKKRVAIAGVLAMQPEMLVMDEPTAGLDFPGMQNLSEIMDRLYTQGTTLVVATHDVDWAWRWADLVYVLAQGQVIAGGPPDTILNCSNHVDHGFARPVVGEIYTAMVNKNGNSGIPRTVAELISLLKGGF
ncbi:MAG: ABC transporter ATP-binding protein [Veillonellaceae bacterium]|jgi:cobalt/nickel transport system ATP-binding protein|nr:ABC transporter ATP-binding protein [Veillonellaceae bacterium]